MDSSTGSDPSSSSSLSLPPAQPHCELSDPNAADISRNGLPFAISCSRPKVDSSGEPACELCGRRLRTVKYHRPHGVGRACHPRCPQPSASSKAPATTPTHPAMNKKRKEPSSTKGQRRYTHSPNDGVLNASSPMSLRVRAPRIIVPDLKMLKQLKEQELSAQLDAAHARRMEALARAIAATTQALHSEESEESDE